MPKNVVCKKCNNLVNDWCEKVIDSPDPDMQRDCQHFCEKTNADRIRSLSDEELAEFISGIAYGRKTPWSKVFEEKCCKNCPVTKCEISDYLNPMFLHECDFDEGKCPHGSDVEWWLQQPAEGE